MTKAKPPEPATAPTQLNLVNSGRLRALRKQAAATKEEQSSRQTAYPNAKEDAEIARLRRQIDQRLAEILAQLPAGKQHSLFKIRFGVTLEELRSLPVKQIAKVLKIEQAIR